MSEMIWTCAAITFSRILDRNGRFEIGRKLLRSLGSKPGFLNIRVIIADLRGAGIEPEEREECMMSVMSGKREGGWSLTRFVGRGSRLRVGDLSF